MPDFDTVLTGTEGNDFLRGSELRDHILGLGGNDQLWGNGGDDTLEGGAGNDILVGGHGLDTLLGGDGDDIYILHYAPDIVSDTSGTDTIRSTISLNLNDFTGIESFEFSNNRALTATGTDGDDIITMNSPQGLILAGGGNDTLVGDDMGNVVFVGGLGRDVMDGGARDYGPPYYGELNGSDRFDFRTVADSLVGAERDVILNFVHAESADDIGDHINLGLIDANTSRTGNQAFTFITGEFTGTAGELRVTVLDFADDTLDRQIVSGDVDGDGVADFEIEVQVEFSNLLTADDFIL